MKHRQQPQRQLSDYQQKLLDPRWQKKRLEILQRDEWCCQACFNDKATLHVHHRYYETGCDPWDYPDEALVTLCAPCHGLETDNRPYIEQGLLRTLRQIGISYREVEDLAYSFSTWESGKRYDFTISAVAWALRDKEMLEEIASKYSKVTQRRAQQFTASNSRE